MIHLVGIWVFKGNSTNVYLRVSDHIDISAVYVLELALIGLHTNAHNFENTCDCHTVTRTYLIDHVIVGAEVDGLGSLTFWDGFRSFLHFNVLLIRENALVVNQLEAVRLIATTATWGFINAASVDQYALFLLTVRADKSAFFHFRNDITTANNDTAKSDQSFNVSRVQLSDSVNGAQVKWSHLDEHIIFLILGHILISCTSSSQSNLLVYNRRNQIKNRNDFNGMLFNLAVEWLVMLPQVFAIDIQYVFFKFAQFLQFLPIVRTA